jgi:4-diphosphocytidyl-2-C-methyl-D-erythritol kinase
MLVFPNAKINLGLNVTGKRPDGFHDIETVLIPVDFRDVLEIIPGGEQEVEFRQSGLTVPGKPEENLCLRAYHLLKNEFSIPSVKIHLNKKIPMGAGLGGGSSDAAFTIKALNELLNLDMSSSLMMQYARQLGSDCAFFIENKPVLALGRGDRFEHIKPALAGYSIVIVIPPIHVSTADAYQQVVVRKPLTSIRDLLSVDPCEWKDRLVNDFEDSVFGRYPGIRMIKEKLYEAGAVYASMSGSGSAVYGLFSKQMPGRLDFPGFFSWEGKLS